MCSDTAFAPTSREAGALYSFCSFQKSFNPKSVALQSARTIILDQVGEIVELAVTHFNFRQIVKMNEHGSFSWWFDSPQQAFELAKMDLYQHEYQRFWMAFILVIGILGGAQFLRKNLTVVRLSGSYPKSNYIEES